MLETADLAGRSHAVQQLSQFWKPPCFADRQAAQLHQPGRQLDGELLFREFEQDALLAVLPSDAPGISVAEAATDPVSGRCESRVVAQDRATRSGGQGNHPARGDQTAVIAQDLAPAFLTAPDQGYADTVKCRIPASNTLVSTVWQALTSGK